VRRAEAAEWAAYHRRVPGPHIVVVEDDEGIGSSLQRTLVGQGYEVEWARTGAEALALVKTMTALVVLDLNLPDQDGLEVCRRLRARPAAPQVLVLTARDDEADVVLGLDAGADDYLTKPFRLAELLARVRACTRRSESQADFLEIGDLTVDIDARTVQIAGAAVELRPKEFELLVALARSAGRVVTRERLLEDVWDEHWFGSTKTLDIHIWALRRKLDAPGATSRITTVRGVGYRMDAP
jgi:DNA-binding response OmpR family regulator